MPTAPIVPAVQALAWHYTTADRARQIIDSGFIRPATAGVPAHESPVVWFSLNQRYEPTAAKLFTPTAGGKPRIASMAQMVALCGGLARFGVPAAQLLTPKELRLQANIQRDMWRLLVAAGRRQGADAELWRGALAPVPAANCIVQVADARLQWTAAEGAAAFTSEG